MLEVDGDDAADALGPAGRRPRVARRRTSDRRTPGDQSGAARPSRSGGRHGNQARHRRLPRRGHRPGPGARHRGRPHPPADRPGRAGRGRGRAGSPTPWPRPPPRPAPASRPSPSSSARTIGDIFDGHAFLFEDPTSAPRGRGPHPRRSTTPPSTPSAGSSARYVKRLEEQRRPTSRPPGAGPTCSTSRSTSSATSWAATAGEPIPLTTEPVIVLAHDLTPSETAGLDPQHGPRLRHRERRPDQPHRHPGRRPGDPRRRRPRPVPHRRLRRRHWSSWTATEGVLILDPDEETLARYEANRGRRPRPSRPATTRSATCRPSPATASRIRLLGQHRVPAARPPHCLDRGAEGVGLYRTEFLYLNKTDRPDRGGALRGVPGGAARRSARTGRSSSARSTSGPTSSRRVVRAARQREEPVPGPAQRPAVPAESRPVQDPAAGHPAGQRLRRRADHVPDDQHGDGAAAVQDACSTRCRRTWRTRESPSNRTCRSVP